MFSSICFAADAIEDVEAEMDTAFAESDAARSEAEAAKARKAEEKSNVEKAKRDAITAMEKAKATELQARNKIATLERETNALRKQRANYEAQIKKSQERIVVAEKKVADAQQLRDKLAVEKQVALEERDKQNELLAEKNNELKKLEDEIAQERAALNRAAVELRELKQKNAKADANAQRRHKAVEKEKAKIGRDRAHYEKLANVERNRASLNYKTIALKQNCALHSDADLGSKVLSRVKKSTRVSVAKYNNEGWFHVDGPSVGYMHKSCK